MRQIGGPETERYVLVDGNNLLHRANYAFVLNRAKEGKPPYCTSSGYPTGLIYGSLYMLAGWISCLPIPAKVCVFFDGIPQRRLDLDPQYKSSREASNLKLVDVPGPTAATLRDGFTATSDVGVLAYLLQLLGCDLYHHPGEESDDLIASFCKKHAESIRVVVSDDKDFFQLLVDPRIALFRPGARGDRFFDAEAAEAHWATFNKGKHPRVPCGQVRMFKSLCGDSSDDIIGVERLRKSVAIRVCDQPNIDAVIATGLPGFSQVERERTISLKSRLELNWKLVGFYDDLDLDACLKPALTDHKLARSIIRDDLGIVSVDLDAFRLGAAAPPLQTQIPLDDWLADI